MPWLDLACMMSMVCMVCMVCMLDTHTLMSGKQSGTSLMAQHTGKVLVAIDKI